MKVILDMDDVTVALGEKCARLYKEETGENLPILHTWEEGKEILAKYYTRKGFFLDLNPVVGADWGVRRLLELGCDVWFATCTPTTWGASEKMEWVEKYFPEIGFRKTIITCNKSQIIGDVIVDDSPEFIKGFTGTRILLDKPYNRLFKDFEYRVWDWNGIIYIVEALLNGKALMRNGQQWKR